MEKKRKDTNRKRTGERTKTICLVNHSQLLYFDFTRGDAGMK
jgi:hypothetical protein